MSYILEALRKADAERERGSVPDLHAQLMPAALPDEALEAPPQPRWLWPAAGVVLAVVLCALWVWASGDDAPAVAATLPAAAPTPTRGPAAPSPPASAAPAPLPGPPPAAEASPPAAAMPAPPAAMPPTPAPPGQRAVAAVGAPTPATATTSQASPAPATPARAAATTPTPDKPEVTAATSATVRAKAPPSPKPPKAAASAAAGPAEKAKAEPPARVPTLNELPEDVRRQVPALAVGGSVYSPQPSVRMVIINGQVFGEGATLAPELLLEQIRPKSAVFSIRGQRFELPL